jgi:hypothetical protein
MALVLGEAVAGGTALAFALPLWNEVRRGFFKLTGSILAMLAIGAWASADAAIVPGDGAGEWVARLTAGVAALSVAWVLLLFFRASTPARGVGLLCIPVSIGLLAAMAATGRQPIAASLFQVLAGAALLGAVTDGLLLGHWYLTDRGLSRAPINRLSTALLVAVALATAAVVSGGFDPVRSAAQVNPLLTTGALAPWIALGMVATTALIAAITRVALRGQRSSAVQAATGFLYLAVVTAFTAEVAMKVRFLPG